MVSLWVSLETMPSKPKRVPSKRTCSTYLHMHAHMHTHTHMHSSCSLTRVRVAGLMISLGLSSARRGQAVLWVSETVPAVLGLLKDMPFHMSLFLRNSARQTTLEPNYFLSCSSCSERNGQRAHGTPRVPTAAGKWE